MLKKWTKDKEGGTATLEKSPPKETREHTVNVVAKEHTEERKVNIIQKGCKVKGDLKVSSDLVLMGEMEGNITALEDSSVVIKGSCKGNIETQRGDIDIKGVLETGNITTEGNVSISGKFTGGEVKVGGRIYVNCEFSGRLEGGEIEVGPNSLITGELRYKEFITISRGAKVDVHLCRTEEEGRNKAKSPENKVVELKPPMEELSGAK